MNADAQTMQGARASAAMALTSSWNILLLLPEDLKTFSK